MTDTTELYPGQRAVEAVNASSELAAELERVRAERQALERARAERDAAEAPSRKLAAEKLALANEQAIEDAEMKHGLVGKRIAVVVTDLGVVIVKRPHPATFKKFQDQGKVHSEALDDLVRPCLVHPALADFEHICEELPGTLLRCANAVTGLAGVRAEEIAGKP